MLDATNAVICAMLLALTYPVAIVMRHTGLWLYRLVFVIIVLVLAAQVLSPVFDFLPQATWLQAVLNAALLCMTILMRADIMAVARTALGPPGPDNHPMRRRTDRQAAEAANGGMRHGFDA